MNRGDGDGVAARRHPEVSLRSPTDGRLPAEAQELSQRMLRVADLTRSIFAELAGGFDLSPVQARAVLRMYEPTPMRDLAEHLCCDASNVTGIAGRLEQRGVAKRVVGSDRRVTLLQLTDKGAGTRRALAARVGSGSASRRSCLHPIGGGCANCWTRCSSKDTSGFAAAEPARADRTRA